MKTDETIEGVKVFVYGTLRTGEVRHGITTFKRMLAPEAYIQGFTMLDLGSFPGLIKGGERIRGEVHEYENLEYLDMIEGFREKEPKTSFYVRRQVNVELPKGLLRDCWVYTLNRRPELSHRTVIASGDWFAHRGYYRVV